MTNTPGWQYYKQALLPTSPPDEEVDLSIIRSGEIWKGAYKNAIFARWTSEFDCESETNWWYVIKTEPFDIAGLNAKKRYKINRGLRFFDIRRIDPMQYREDIYRVQVEAYKAYPEKYRPSVDEKKIFSLIEQEWTRQEVEVYAAFHRETGAVEGYIQLLTNGRCIHSVAQKATPEQEKYQINYALLAGVLEAIAPRLEQGAYLNVGARNIQHETTFQDFVEDIFGFRKAYCKLNIAYNPKFKWIVEVLYLLRAPLKKLDHIGIVHKINGVLQMEHIIRQQAKG